MASECSSPLTKAVGSFTGDDKLIGSITLLTLLAEKRIERHITEQETKRVKYKSIQVTAKFSAELELEKEKLKQQERLLEMQYQCEHEREAHELQMMQMQMALRNPDNLTGARPSMPPAMHSTNMDLDFSDIFQFGFGQTQLYQL